MVEGSLRWCRQEQRAGQESDVAVHGQQVLNLMGLKGAVGLGVFIFVFIFFP